MGRRASRSVAMKLLYQLDIQKNDREEQIALALEENNVTENDEKYIRTILEGVLVNLQQLDNEISRNMRGWKLSRISKIDLAILRMSFFEIMHMESVPVNVSINEAVKLAKVYSGEESGAFVNGVLGKAAALRAEA